jgi:hypothetical protein
MAIGNIKKYENSFLIFSALLIAVVNTLPFFSSIFSATHDNSHPFRDQDFIIRRSLWYFFHSFVSILIFAYFNYSIKDFIIPKKLHRILKILLIILYNILLVYLLLKGTIYFAEITVGNPFGEKIAFYFYLWKYILLNPLAILLAFVLHLVVKTKIIEIENIKLKEENLISQLKTLQDQINPHFLFNTLNTLSSVIRLDTKNEGLKFVDDLSSVYRYILESDKTKLVKVQSELDFLESYNYMLKKRFNKKLQLLIEIPDAIKSTLIPPMVLQLLVENAIKHNKVSQSSPLIINIFAREKHIIVKNNLQRKSNNHENIGLGLPNLIQRYKLLTGKDVIISQTKESFIVKLPIIRS